MAGTMSQLPTATPREGGLLRSKDLHKRGATIRRSYSDNHISHNIKASMVKKSRSSNGLLSASAVTLKSFFLDSETSREMNANVAIEDAEMQVCGGKKRGNWIEMIMELRSKWKVEPTGGDDCVESSYGGGEEGCHVDYEDDGDAGGDVGVDRERFSSMLERVSWSDTKLFARLAFLCNMAYVIPDLKKEDLRRHYGLEFVTSSLEKKAAAAAMRDQIDQDSIGLLISSEEEKSMGGCSSSAAYEIAASAASYVQSYDRLHHDEAVNEDETCSSRMQKSERAACVAASRLTALVAAGEKQKEEAAKDLQSLHSAPCEWFVCDDSDIYTRCFVIQGSDSLASWQANLFFEPAKFEGTNVLVHRGIYEAAKGIYDQVMPEIKEHLKRFGERAKLQFTGHSLGGSLALLVNLMLLTRHQLKLQNLLPVVSFGSPFVFCGGHKILEELGLDETHVRCVMMHRDIVPRAFSCSYPNYVAQVLRRLSGTFRQHPCLNKNKLLYTPMGKMFILQPHEKSSPAHPLLPSGCALYELQHDSTSSAFREFLNSPHPLETLSDPTAYGSEGTIIRDHDSSNYLKAMHEVIRQDSRVLVRRARKERNQMWPLLASRSPHAWSHTCYIEGDQQLKQEVLTGV